MKSDTLKWNDGNRNGTSLLDFLGESYLDTDRLITALETAAGVKGDWDGDEDGESWGECTALSTARSSRSTPTERVA